MSKDYYGVCTREDLKVLLKVREKTIDDHNRKIKENLETIKRLQCENGNLYTLLKCNKLDCAAIRRELAVKGV